MLKDRHDKEKPLRLPRQPQLPAIEQLRQMHQECVKHPGVVAELPFGDAYMLTACRQAGSSGCEWQLYQQESGDLMVEMVFDANDPRFVHQQITNYFPHWSTAGQRRTNEQPNIFAQNQTPGRKDKPAAAAGQPKDESSAPIMEGDLSVLKLAALLRSMGRQQITGHLHVKSGNKDAFIYVIDGVAVHCEFADYEGPDAFRAVAALPSGKFFFYKGPRSERHTLPKDLEALIKSHMVLPPQKSQGKSVAKVVGTFPALASGTAFQPVKAPATSSFDNLPKNPHASENPMELQGQAPAGSSESLQNAVPPPAMRNPNQSSADFELQKPAYDQNAPSGMLNQSGFNQGMPPRAQPLTSSPGVPSSTKPFDPQLPLADQLRKRLTWSNMVPPAIGPTKPDQEKEPEGESPGLLDLLGTLPENPARAPKASRAELGVPENLLSEDFKQQLRTGEHIRYSAPERPDNWAQAEGHPLPGENAEPHPQPDDAGLEPPPPQPDVPSHSEPPMSWTGTPHRLEPPPMPWTGNGTPHGLEAHPQPQSASPLQSATNLPASAPFQSPPQPDSAFQSATNLPASAPFQSPPQPDSAFQSATNLPASAPFQSPPQPDSAFQSGTNLPASGPFQSPPQPDSAVQSATNLPASAPFQSPQQPDSPFQSGTNLPASAPFQSPEQPDSPFQSGTNLPASAPFQSPEQPDSPFQSGTNLPPSTPPQPAQHHSPPRISFYSEIPQPPESPPTPSQFNQTPDFAVPQQFPGFSQPAPQPNLLAPQSDHEIAPADLTWNDPIQGFATAAAQFVDEPTAAPPAEPPHDLAGTAAEPPPALPPANQRPIPEVSINPFAPPLTTPWFMPHADAAPTHFPDPFPASPSAPVPIPEEATNSIKPPPAPPSIDVFPFVETAIKPPDFEPTTKPTQDIAARLAARLAAQGTHDSASQPETPTNANPNADPSSAYPAPHIQNDPKVSPPSFMRIPDASEPAAAAPKSADEHAAEPPLPRAVFRPIPDFPTKPAEQPVSHDASQSEPAPPRAIFRPIPDFPAKTPDPAISHPPAVSSKEPDWTSKPRGSGPLLDFGKPTDVVDFSPKQPEPAADPAPPADPTSSNPPIVSNVSAPIISHVSSIGSQPSLFGSMSMHFLAEEAEEAQKQEQPDENLDPIFGHTPPPIAKDDEPSIILSSKKDKHPEHTLILPAVKKEPSGPSAESTLILPAMKKEVPSAAAGSTLILPAMKNEMIEQAAAGEAESTLILPTANIEEAPTSTEPPSEPTLILPPKGRKSPYGITKSVEPTLILPSLSKEAAENALHPAMNVEPATPQETAAESEEPETASQPAPPQSQPLSATAGIIARAASKAAARSAATRHDPFQDDNETVDEEPEAKPPELLFEPLFQFAPKASKPPAPPEAKPHANPWLNLQQSRAKSLAEKEKEKEQEKEEENEAQSLILKPTIVSAEAFDPTRTLSLEEKGVRGYSKSDRQHVRSGLVNRETQLYTFAALMYFVELEFVRAMRYNRSFALLVMQVGYKPAKSKHAGRVQPLAADTMALLSTKIMDIKRPPDLLGHFDPAGLAIFMPDTDRSVASQFASRLAEMLSQIEPAAWTDFNPLEFMLGVAAAPEDAHDMETLTKEAVKYQVRHILP